MNLVTILKMQVILSKQAIQNNGTQNFAYSKVFILLKGYWDWIWIGFYGLLEKWIYLPPMSAIEVLSLHWCVCLPVCQHSRLKDLTYGPQIWFEDVPWRHMTSLTYISQANGPWNVPRWQLTEMDCVTLIPLLIIYCRSCKFLKMT